MRKALLALALALPGLAFAQATHAVVVEVRRDGKPVAAANVTLDDGTKKQDALIDASSKGEADFANVKAGAFKVTVRYRAEGKDAAPVTQLFDAKAGDRLTVTLPDSEKASVEAASPVAAPTKPAPTGGFNPVGTLFALLLGGGAAAGIWYFIKHNPDTVGGTLEKLGAQIPKPGDAPLADPPVAAAPAPAPIAPEPPQKIVLDPVPVAPIPIAAPSGTSYGEPSLVSDAGIPIPLPEGETTVGREIGLGLSLAGESTVSRRHAKLVRSGGTITLEDVGSTNGTFVNGAPVGAPVVLQPGDAVQFGSVRFRYGG